MCRSIGFCVFFLVKRRPPRSTQSGSSAASNVYKRQVLSESLGSIGGGMHVDLKKQSVVGIELNASHLKSVSSGWVYGKATAVRIGNKIQVWEIDITDEDENKICKGRLTLAVINKK